MSPTHSELRPRDPEDLSLGSEMPGRAERGPYLCALLVGVCLALLAGPATAMPSEATATDDADAGRRDADEDAMFGGDEDEQEGENAEKSGKKPADAHEDFGDARMSEKATVKSELLDADKLQIGGLMYARNGVFFAEGIKFHNASLSQSTLTDIYLDARPNDRIRRSGWLRSPRAHSRRRVSSASTCCSRPSSAARSRAPRI